MSQQSELIHKAPPPNEDNSLFLVYASAQQQDWLYTIMQWSKTRPIDVSCLEPYSTISLWTHKTSPGGIIYCCKRWSEEEGLIIAQLRSSFPNMAIVVVLEQNYYAKIAERALCRLRCKSIFKNNIECKANIIAAFEQAKSVLAT